MFDSIKLKDNKIYIVTSSNESLNSGYIEAFLANTKELPKLPGNSTKIGAYFAPSVSDVFYKHLIETNCIPTWKKLWEEYFSSYFNMTFDNMCELVRPKDIAKFNHKKFTIRELKTLIVREYPELIRDLHFYLLCKESGLFSEVSCIVTANMPSILLTVNNEKFNVFFFASNKYALYQKIKGELKGNLLREVLIRLDTEKMKNINGYMLCTEEYICDVLNYIGKLPKNEN